MSKRHAEEKTGSQKPKLIKRSSSQGQVCRNGYQSLSGDSGYSEEHSVSDLELDEHSTYSLTGSEAAEGCSFNSHDSQTENTLENVFPMDVLDEDSCEMDVDENSPDPSRRPFAEHCLQQKIKIGKGKSSLDSVLLPACALLNSGGGVLEITVEDYSKCKFPLQKLDTFWQGLEEKLEAMIKPLSYAKVFDRVIKQDKVSLFIKAPDHWCTLEYNLFLSGDSRLGNPSFSETVKLLSDKPLGKKKKKKFSACKVHLKELPSLPKKFRYKELLDFHESKKIQFKHFPSNNPLLHNNSHTQRESVVNQISAFANVSGGIILLGVKDDGTVLGQNMDSKGNSKKDFEQRLDSIVREMKWSFTPERKLHLDVKFFPVHGKEGCFVIAIYVAGVRGGVFARTPKSFELRPGEAGNEAIHPVEFEEWKKQMLRGTNILQNDSTALKHLTEKFSRFTISSGVLLTVKGSVGRIRDSFFTVEAGCPVSPKGFESDLPESAQSVIRQIQDMSSKGRARALLVGSRSWLSCIKKDGGENLPGDGFICDLLLLNAELGGLHLFTLCDSDQEEQFLSYSHTTAKALKKALVADGGCREKFYITYHVVPCRSPVQISQLPPDSRYPPKEYELRSSREKLNEILDSLVRLLAVVPSALSNKQGMAFFNLLTKEQFKLLYQEIDRFRELWIKGAAGTGKTFVAIEFMKELLRRDSSLTKDEILYVCENKGIRQQISKLHICQCVCRKTFMACSFSEVKHIIMDEVQSFTDEDRGHEEDNWLQKAKKIVREHSVDPGFLWLFIDNRQINHWHPTGIPPEKEQTPFFTLTKVIRNSERIFKFASKNILSEKAAAMIEMGHDFEGEKIVGKRYKAGNVKSQISVLKSVLQSLSTEGYSKGDIAVLYGKSNCIPKDLEGELHRGVIVDAEENDSENLVVSTLRKYSGLERPVVILVNVENSNSLPYKSNGYSAFYCCATRAMVKLVLLRPKVEE